MRNDYKKDTLTSVEFQEFATFGRNAIELCEGVFYCETFKISPFRKVIEKMFALGQNCKDEGNDLMPGLDDFKFEQFIRSSNTQRF